MTRGPEDDDDFAHIDDDEHCYEDEEAFDYDDCGLMSDGQCTKAGSEECDFTCPNRHSELFAGSKAWHEKHARKKRSR